MSIEKVKKSNSTESEEIEAVLTRTNSDLETLGAEISSNNIENLSTWNLEELYNRSRDLDIEIYNLLSTSYKRQVKKDELETYLNNMALDDEKLEVHKLIDKYQSRIDEKNQKKEKLSETKRKIDLELKERFNGEPGSGGLNQRFTKAFNLGLSEINSNSSDGTKIHSTIVKENWEETWMEIKIIRKWGGGECLFKDNNGNFYISRIDEIEEWNNDNRKIATVEKVCSFLKKIHDITKSKDEENNKSLDMDALYETADFTWITEEIVHEYIDIIKRSGKIPDILADSLKKDLWFENITSEVSYTEWLLLFYVTKFCHNKSREIISLVHKMAKSSMNVVEEYGILKRTLKSIKFYWDSAYEFLTFCSPFDGSYAKEWISHMQGKNFWETLDQMRQRYDERRDNLPDNMKKDAPSLEDKIKSGQDLLGNTTILVQYFENFVQEHESINLFNFLKENPQKLENLWWKEIQTINLSLDSWINFAFRWIIEMVKSRPDISFPHLGENASESEKKEWKEKREKIIKEYELMLRNYIARDKQEKTELKWKTFDKIFFTLSQWDMWFSGKDSDLMPSKEWAQQFSWNEVLDYSDDDEKYRRWESEKIKMISDLEEYVNKHPNEKILVCINQHGSPNWSSGNWWSKEDWIRLANISPNIKIRSIRCYLWTAFSNEDIYNYKSSISWFSNNTVAISSAVEIMSEASDKNLWFHEMELYIRLHYPVTVSPLTENMEYTNRNTWETEIWKVWLAQNGNQNGIGSDVSYA